MDITVLIILITGGTGTTPAGLEDLLSQKDSCSAVADGVPLSIVLEGHHRDREEPAQVEPNRQKSGRDLPDPDQAAPGQGQVQPGPDRPLPAEDRAPR